MEAFLGDDAFGGEHGDVAEFDRRVASALAIAFEHDWSGLVVAVGTVKNGALVNGVARAVGDRDGVRAWRAALRELGLDVGD